MGHHPLLLEWHGLATVSRSVWEFVEGFVEGISKTAWLWWMQEERSNLSLSLGGMRTCIGIRAR